MNPDARVLMVTGASSGIGKAVALLSAAAGDHVVLVARGKAALDRTAAECVRSGAASVLVRPTDVGDDSAVAHCFTETLERYDHLDVVVHCAAVVAYGRVEHVPPDVFEAVLRTNLTGSINVARHAVAIMRSQSEGSLVLVGSITAHLAVPSMGAYVLSKWGVRILARQLQIENRDLRKLNIVHVTPAGVDTPIYRQAANYQGFAGRPPPPVASPERVARIILAQVAHHGSRKQIGVANDVMRFGFTVLPWLFDLLVTPAVKYVASDRSRPVPPGPGNVLESADDANQLHGNYENAMWGIGRNVLTLAKSIRRGRW